MRATTAISTLLTALTITGCSTHKSVDSSDTLGDLALISMPEGARVRFSRVEGPDLGPADSTVTPDTVSLLPGSYVIQFEHPGYQNLDTSHVVISESLESVEASMKPK